LRSDPRDGAVFVADEQDVLAGNRQLALKRHDELLEPHELRGGGAVLIKIADEADADAIGSKGAGDRPGRLLPRPAAADLDLAVGRALAVTDHKMIGQPAGPFPERLRITDGSQALMNVNIVPLPGENRRRRLEDPLDLAIIPADRKEAAGRAGGQRAGIQYFEQKARAQKHRQKTAEDDDAAPRCGLG